MTLFLLDVNVVIAGHRDDHPHYVQVQPWLDRLLNSADLFLIPTGVALSFLRLVTNRRVFSLPTPRSDAFDYLSALLAQPGHIALGPGSRHFEILRGVCEEADATADLIADAGLVALAIEHGATIASFDRDFSRFSFVPHVRPSA